MPGRAYSHVITKISRMGGLPHFLRYRATLARSRGALLQTSNRSCHPSSCIFVPFFPWFQAVIWLFLLRKTCEIFRHFSPAELTKPCPQGFSVATHFFCWYPALFTSCHWISQTSSKFGQRLLVIKELAVGLKPIRGGDASSFNASQSYKPLSTEPKSKVYAIVQSVLTSEFEAIMGRYLGPRRAKRSHIFVQTVLSNSFYTFCSSGCSAYCCHFLVLNTPQSRLTFVNDH